MKKMLIALVMCMLLVACSDEMEQQEVVDYDVQLQIDEQIAVGEQVELQVSIKNGDNYSEDVDDVQFEVWESGKRETAEKIDGVTSKQGIYKAPYTFIQQGVYYVYAHTNVNGLHYMPKQQIIVGNPNMSNVLPDEDDGMMHHE